MKTYTSIRPIASLIAALVACALTTVQAEAQTRSARAEVTSVTGSATFVDPATGETVTVKKGITIPAGATITTGEGSSVDLFLGRSSGVVRLSDRTTLKIERLDVTNVGSEWITDTLLKLEKGEVFANVNKLSSASSYKLALPDGEMDVRESRFQVAFRGLDSFENGQNGQFAANGLRSIIKVASGNAQFVEGGESHNFNGPGQYNPSTDSVGPLSRTEVTALNKTFRVLNRNSNKASNNSNQTGNNGQNNSEQESSEENAENNNNNNNNNNRNNVVPAGDTGLPLNNTSGNEVSPTVVSS